MIDEKIVENNSNAIGINNPINVTEMKIIEEAFNAALKVLEKIPNRYFRVIFKEIDKPDRT